MEGIICTPLKRIANEKGDILHAMKRSDAGYVEFGEAYFTSILFGEIKGWKKHTQMTMNLVVPVGSVAFYLHDENSKKTERVLISAENYCRLTVAPGIWVAFEGVEESLNLVLNLASMEHDPFEAINKPLDTFPLV
ncbi:WxcM-like domain-containing protein [Vibrio navarrensis]|uniref:WxcM-like domain-containing protein n=1 Tax=Vibrio navarrensis TaxID=29495 RepID=UPI0018680D63|nr:WxcM-like domain-containing protein [Vibrio navarrensis]MBE3654122.1 dTDP-4-dehydrorhamnose 3,5-epimerase [Vibrio navarrensis]